MKPPLCRRFERLVFLGVLALSLVAACSSEGDVGGVATDAASVDDDAADTTLGDAGVGEDTLNEPSDTPLIGTDTADSDADAARSDTPSDAPLDAPVDARPSDAADTTDLHQEPDPAVPPHCGRLAVGEVTDFPVGPMTRSFDLYLPEGLEDRRDWPVVFGWHGYGEAPRAIGGLLRDEINGPDYEFIYVVPDDISLELPFGADWDNLNLSDGFLEAVLGAVLECLDLRWGVDSDRVHTIGFSAGAITSNVLGVLRGDRIASIASLSGAYWSNPANFNAVASWPDLPSRSPRYVQLLTWGGAQTAPSDPASRSQPRTTKCT
jgi:hypothetical protein